MKILTLFALFTLTGATAIAAENAEKKEIKGGLDKGVIDEQIKRHIRQIRHCYEKELNASAKPASGKIKTHFTIGPSGKVTKAEISSTTLKNEKTETCVLGVINHIAFPEPVGGGTVDVDYPFSFSPNVESSKKKEE